MKKIYSFTCFIPCLLLLFIKFEALATYVPISVSGYNADVVADVQFNALGSTNNDVDGVNYVFISQSYNPTGTSYMPINNIVNSVVPSTPGLTYQLAPYTSNNSLRLFGGSTGALTFNSPQSASEIFVLGATGSGSSTATITVTFTDLTTQVFPGQVFVDWFGGANFAIQGLGRTLRTTNTILNDPSNPRLYQIKLDLLPANYGKQIQSLTFANTGAYLNVMGISINTPPAPYDPSVASITAPIGNCFSASQTITAQVCNSGSNAISLASNPIAITLKVIGPLGTNFYSVTMNSGILAPAGTSCQTATFNGVNMFAGGTYYLNTSLVISGLPNAYLNNDSLVAPVIKFNARPHAGPDYHLCQFDAIPFGQGLIVSGCATPISDSVTIPLTITGPCLDNLGSTANGSGIGSNCADAYSCNFADGLIPTLPVGAAITAFSLLKVTHLATQGSSFVNEVRMNLYGSAPLGINLFSPGLAGGTGLSNPDFTYSRLIPPIQIGSMLSTLPPGSIFHIGYWESFNDNFLIPDIGINGGGNTTVATLTIYYDYVPASFEWYNVPSGGTNLYNFSPFNPIITAGSGITNSNIAGTSTFFAACVGSSDCRIPVNLIIDPSPLAYQDTISQCENAVASNSAVFDLTTMDGPVSGFNLAATVDYFFDEPLITQVTYPTHDTSSTNFIYVKVSYPGTGCFSKDSLLLNVVSLPDFPTNVLTGNTCVPGCIDVRSLLNPFGTSPPGTDTFYYTDPNFVTICPNPYAICGTDTIYVILATNTNPICADTAIAYIDILPPSNYIAGQDIPGNFSMTGSYGCPVFNFTDGASDTLRTTSDCKRMAAITDITNLVDLGATSVCEEIASGTQFHNGQPYVNRVYHITSTNSDTANVCLYYLDEDLEEYNATALISGWPFLPTSANPSFINNVAITKVDNGNIGTPGHMATAIPNTQITSTYDTATTVWTICFPVNGFSYFYLHSQNPANIPLPVSLLAFTARLEGGKTYLNWSTSNEENNHHFIVERSSDGIHFLPLSNQIPSKAVNGNSHLQLDYDFIDSNPFQGNTFYRLQQIDINKKLTYSNILKVQQGEEAMVEFFPNPVKDLLHLTLNASKSSSFTLNLLDATGRILRSEKFKLQAGQHSLEMSMQDLADGIYMISLSNERGFQVNEKIRKQ